MIPAYTVWEWNRYNGWRLFLGSASSSMADQVRRALSLYQPQAWYQSFPRKYSLSPAFDVVGSQFSRNYTWGATPDAETAWISLYALSKLLRPDVLLAVKPYPPHSVSEVSDAMPSFARIEMAQRYRYA